MRTPSQHPDNRVTPVNLDVTDIAQIQRAAGQVEALDVLINNAGISIYDDLTDPDVIRKHLAVNLLGVAHVTQTFLPLLERSSGGIVNCLSLASLAPLPVVPGYSISKAAGCVLVRQNLGFLDPAAPLAPKNVDRTGARAGLVVGWRTDDGRIAIESHRYPELETAAGIGRMKLRFELPS